MFRVKAASTSRAPLNERMAMVLQSFVNLQANGLAFAPHEAVVLAQDALERKLQPLKLTKPVASANHYYCSAEYAKESLQAAIRAGSHSVSFPLPQYFLNPEEDTADLESRSFVHHSDIETSIPLSVMLSPKGAACTTIVTPYGDKPRYAWPRCGLTGLFYRREDIVDNLIRAATVLQFKSPFWIPEHHPRLGTFLKVRSGQQPIMISVATRVAPVEVVHQVPVPLITSQLRDVRKSSHDSSSVSPFNNANVPCGTNIITGLASRNPFLRGEETSVDRSDTTKTGGKGSKKATPTSSPPAAISKVTSQGFRNFAALRNAKIEVNNRGIWISLAQFIRHGMTLRSELSAPIPKDATPDDELLLHIKRLLELFVVVEDQQLVLYNADQLEVPGRLGLKDKTDFSADPTELFR